MDDKKRKKELELISKTMDDSKYQMIWFLKPADEKGIAFLKKEYEILTQRLLSYAKKVYSVTLEEGSSYSYSLEHYSK